MKNPLPALSLALLLGACSEGEPTAPEKTATSSDAQRPTLERRAYNPWQDPMRAMDKAKGMEGLLREGVRRQDEQLRQMEQ